MDYVEPEARSKTFNSFQKMFVFAAMSREETAKTIDYHSHHHRKTNWVPRKAMYSALWKYINVPELQFCKYSHIQLSISGHGAASESEVSRYFRTTSKLFNVFFCYKKLHQGTADGVSIFCATILSNRVFTHLNSLLFFSKKRIKRALASFLDFIGRNFTYFEFF